MISLKSDITKKLLTYFFLNPDASLYLNEITKTLNVDKRNLAKKLFELEEEGLLKKEIRGNLSLYSINKSYPLYKEYKKIILKTAGFEKRIKEILQNAGKIKVAYIYGSYAKDKMYSNSDIDLLVVGSHNIIDLQRDLRRLQNEIGRNIDVINMDEKELKKRIKNKDQFILGVLNNKHIKLM